MSQRSVTYRYKEHPSREHSFRMSELEWIGVASKAFTYCGHLLRIVRKGREALTKQQEEIADLKTKVKGQKKVIDELTGKNGGYDTVN